ncbi:hypothetical protein K431DRAFT_215363 [Polychaeton citri CBS 116435]|uniref:NTF2-like domain-containing protein n=1 Tax=Polychaeton citri CBS 116435 TaxID=1314669 RepID=A0A9P4QFY4_9PEZI|nr:hypothetical protein K431DRAFT_215363 [Polychaeton citri CBS 116435]
MHAFVVAAISLLAGSAAASPRRFRCMRDSDAQQVATNFGNLIAAYTDALADAALSPNIKDYSESVNSLINTCPEPGAATVSLLAPTFDGLDAFKAGQGSQPAINFQQLNMWHSCDTVTLRWETTNAANITNPKPVVGIVALETCPAPAGSEYPYLIDTIYSEFDAAAWVQDLQAQGVCPTSCEKQRKLRH